MNSYEEYTTRMIAIDMDRDVAREIALIVTVIGLAALLATVAASFA